MQTSAPPFDLRVRGSAAVSHFLHEVASASPSLPSLWNQLKFIQGAQQDVCSTIFHPWQLLDTSLSASQRAQIHITGASLLDMILLYSPSAEQGANATHAVTGAPSNHDTLRAFIVDYPVNAFHFEVNLRSHTIKFKILGLRCLDMAAVCVSVSAVDAVLAILGNHGMPANSDSNNSNDDDAPPLLPPLLSARTPCFVIWAIINGLLQLKSLPNTRFQQLLQLAIRAATTILARILPRFQPQQLCDPVAEFQNLSFQQTAGLLFSVAATTQRLLDIADLFQSISATLASTLALPPPQQPSHRPGIIGWICSSANAVMGFGESEKGRVTSCDILHRLLQHVHRLSKSSLHSVLDQPCMDYGSFHAALNRHSRDHLDGDRPTDVLSSEQLLLEIHQRLVCVVSSDCRTLTPALVATVFGNLGLLQAMPPLPEFIIKQLMQLCSCLGYSQHVRILEWLWRAFRNSESDTDKQAEMLDGLLRTAVPVHFGVSRAAVLRFIGGKAQELDVLDRLSKVDGLSDDDKIGLGVSGVQSAAAKSTNSNNSKQTTTTAAAAAAAPANTGGVNDQPTPEFMKGFRKRIGQVGGRLSSANIALAKKEWLALQNGGVTGTAAAPAATPAPKAPAAAPAATPAVAKKASPKQTSPKKAKAATAATGAATTVAAAAGGKKTPAPAPKKKPAAKGKGNGKK